MDRAVVQDVVDRHWTGVLGLSEPAGSDDGADFFALGGDSLAAIELLQRLEDDLAVELAPELMFFDGTRSGIVDACCDTLRLR